jgi:hypothetical protein
VAGWLLIFLLSLASAKSEPPKLFNKFDEIRNWSQPVVNTDSNSQPSSRLGDYHRARSGIILLLTSCATLSLTLLWTIF